MNRSALLGAAFCAAATVAGAGSANAAACLTTPSSVVGNPVFGATVQTFVDLGVDPNTTCIENGLWTAPSNFVLGTYVKGSEGWGRGTDNTVFGQIDLDGSLAGNANGLDHRYVIDTSPDANIGGIAGSAPSQGIVWDLGGQSNQVAVFSFVDHGPVPQEALESTVWLSNDPDGADASWVQARLAHVYGAGWEADPVITDGFVGVYQLPDAATFRYVSVSWGGPGALLRDEDNEIDAVGGLTFSGVGVPEPGTLLLLAGSVPALSVARRRRRVPRWAMPTR